MSGVSEGTVSLCMHKDRLYKVAVYAKELFLSAIPHDNRKAIIGK